MNAPAQQEGNLSQPDIDIMATLHEQIATLNVRLEVQRHLKEHAIAKTNELIEELEGE